MKPLTMEQSQILKGLYAKGLNDYEVARIVHLGRNTLREWRSANDILSKTNKKGLSEDLCDNIMRKLAEGETLTSVGSSLGVARSSIKRLLDRHGYTFHSNITPHPDWVSDYRLTNHQKSVLFGDMFGDGCLVKTSKDSAYYQCSHAEKQEPFVVWKFSQFRPLSSRIHRGDMKNYLNPDRDRINYISMSSWTSKELGAVRAMFYPSGKGDKVLTPELVTHLDALSLAVWYMGDGSKNKKTGYFTVGKDQDCRALEKALNTRFGNMFEARDYGKQWSLFVRAPLFFPLVTPFILSSMAYKIPEDYRDLLIKWGDFASIYGDGTFTKETFYSLDEAQKNLLIDDATEYYYVRGFPFPEATTSEHRRSFESLVNIPVIIADDGKVPSSNAGTSVCNALFSHRYQAMRSGRRVLDVWKNKARLQVFIRNRFKHFNSPFTDTTIRTGVSLGGLPNNFNPTSAKALYEKYLPAQGSTLDFSAGYGGRLLGFLASAVGSEYVGVEPLTLSYAGLCKLKEAFPSDKRVILNNTTFEDYDIGGKKYDLIFSSPPYFDLEVYGDEKTQSIVRYPEYDSWLTHFWFVTLRKVIEALHPGGILIFSLGNCGDHDLISDTLRYLAGTPLIRLPDHYSSFRKVYNSSSKLETIFVFKKSV